MQKRLTEVVIDIAINQYLSDIEPFKTIGIPSNTIVNKTLPGLGATTWEILYKRDSICVLPNVPAIKGKLKKHPNILGVYKGVDKSEVDAYLKSPVTPKKILCTPEGYIDKVKPVLEANHHYKLYNDFFLLLDECDKLVTDVDYRGKITAPIKDFFLFDKKAMISATVLIPSHKQLYTQGFSVLTVKPTFDYRKPIAIINTNNIIATVAEVLSKPRTNPLFIFLNSTDTIHAIIKLLNIEVESKVFCAEDSVKKLSLLGFEEAYSDLDLFDKFNFFTGRFFSSLDIDLDYKPDVVMITDVYLAKHSILDPITESVQICGRFRNGIGEVTHITNFNSNLSSKSENGAREYLNGGYSAYSDISVKIKTSQNEGEVATYKQAIANVEMLKYIDDQEELDPFMVDNFVSEERVKGYYQASINLVNAYDASSHFDIYLTQHRSTVSDEDNMRLMNAKNKTLLIEAVSTLLQKYNTPVPEGTFLFYDPQTEINKLKEKYKEIYEAYELLGYKGLVELEFNKTAVKAAVKKALKEKMIHNPAMVSEIHLKFESGEVYQESQVSNVLAEIYTQYKVNFKVAASHILRYFNGHRTSENNVKAYMLKSPINSTQID
ncbi:hypothetical protein [Rubrolithibacter danxiaensis]|uniref:hypothetical protein n=1 Tax=Rubrolithibacter danxiaensis TaxID=3390805 RepID=UPI003BF7ECC0